jgi:hypothetical protein
LLHLLFGVIVKTEIKKGDFEKIVQAKIRDEVCPWKKVGVVIASFNGGDILSKRLSVLRNQTCEF